MNDVELTRAIEACKTICRLLPRNSPSRVEMEKRRQGMIDELSKRRHAAMRNDALRTLRNAGIIDPMESDAIEDENVLNWCSKRSDVQNRPKLCFEQVAKRCPNTNSQKVPDLIRTGGYAFHAGVQNCFPTVPTNLSDLLTFFKRSRQKERGQARTMNAA